MLSLYWLKTSADFNTIVLKHPEIVTIQTLIGAVFQSGRHRRGLGL
jgi:hypothetical protein